jgi:hypothetical protein
MDPLIGIWRLIESTAWDEEGANLGAPYGANPIGQISFTTEGRMLAALCNGDAEPRRDGGCDVDRGYSSYGGFYELVDTILTVSVDMASDKSRIGGQQIREAILEGDRLLLRPPMRLYGGIVQQRELVWERAWSAVAG